MTSEEETRLRRFAALMRREIDANAHKGDRSTRLPVTGERWLFEIDHHLDKLARAVEHFDQERTREHGADVANCCLFLLDSLGLLEEDPPAVTYGFSIYGEDYG